jgi:hypothetical protein
VTHWAYVMWVAMPVVGGLIRKVAQWRDDRRLTSAPAPVRAG